MDNKTLAKLIAKKVETSLDIKVDIAYTQLEAKLFIKRYTYFISLLDLNLPDAPNGEIVDFVLSKNIPVIVLSANIDKEFRQKMLQKSIIDYVNKGGVNDINYIIHTIDRLRKNQKHTLLVVDDSIVFRKQMQSMLQHLFFKVITVAHGEEALAMLEQNSNISLVLTDYNMPVMDGLELTYEIRKHHDKNELCILAISSNQDEEINALFLKQGANDYVKKPFSKEEFSCRVNNSIEALENIQIVTNHAKRDYLTGLYNRRYFFDAMQTYMQDIKESTESFTLIMVAIDYFEEINERYTHKIGEQIIILLSEILRTTTSYKDLVASFADEEFCIVLKDINEHNREERLSKIEQNLQECSLKIDRDNTLNFTISIAATDYDNEELEETLSRADMLLYKAQKAGGNQLLFA